MITVAMEGRLGNQMFQYAFALAASQALQTSFQMLPNYIGDEVLRYFDTHKVLSNYAPNKIDKLWHRLARKLGRTHSLTEDQQNLLPALYNYCMYSGYFQSECYFLKVEDTLRRLFMIKKKCREDFEQAKVRYDLANSIVLHIRVGDFVQWGGESLGGLDMSLPASYYRNALEQLQWDGEPLMVVTDDIAGAREKLSFLPAVTWVSEKPIIDFQLMMHASKLIISNSTFAWWAAWLNPNQPKIMAPRYWLGFKVGKEFPHGIMSKKFTPVPVF